jgi:glycosyltransferase involved in cell wall biosynthesis
MSGVPEPLVSIVVISKDDPWGLTATLRSIESQTARDYEVVVICKGGSTAVDVAQFQLARWSMTEQASGGISAAFNEGIGLAKGEWINFLNGGDRYMDGRVLERVGPRLAGDAVSIVTARSMDRQTGIRIPRDRSFGRHDLELVSHQASFFRRNLFDSYGPYAEEFRIRMDFEWMLRVPLNTPMQWIDDVIVDFEGGGISRSRPVSSCLEELKALSKHRPGLFRILLVLGFYLPLRTSRHLWHKLRVGTAGVFQSPGTGAS